MRPSRSTSNALVLVVPWSIARIHSPAIYASRLQQFQRRAFDARRSQSKVFEQKLGRAGGSKHVGHAENAHGRGMFDGQDLCHSSAQSACRQRFFRGDNAARGARCIHNRLAVQRFHGAHIQHAR